MKIISCPKCGRKLTVESKLFGHSIGCPFCLAKFIASNPARRSRPSGWQSFLSGFLVPFVAIAKFARRLLNDLTPDHSGGPTPLHLHRSSYGNGGDELFERDEVFFEEEDHYDDLDGNDLDEDDSDEGLSRERRYYDSHGMYVGYRDEEGWVHAEGGRNYIGHIDDDGTFYDSSGMYRGQVDLHDGSGYMWEDREGYTGFQDGSRFSEEGHAGIPDIYEEGGEGTGGAFKALLDDVDDEEW